MERVSGIGGVFFKAKDPERLRNWYRDLLGLEVHPAFGGVIFEAKAGDQTLWTPFDEKTAHFPGSLMVNFRVPSLAKMIAQLRAGGAQVDEKIDEGEFGKFGWATDPEGNRVELWEPPALP